MPWWWSEFTRRAVHGGEAVQQAAGGEGDVVGGGVLFGERAWGVAVVGQAGGGVDGLEQGAAEGDVDLLEAAADAEDGQAGGHGLAYEGQGHGVARGIGQGGGVLLGGAVEGGGDVAGGTGEHQAVQRGQELCEVLRGGAGELGGDDEGERVGALGEGGEVFVLDGVGGVLGRGVDVGDHADDGFHG